VVVLWPRIIPKSETPRTRALAGSVQEKLRVLVDRALPKRAVDVRPEPERVCPQAGCQAPALGVLLLRKENGCALVALVSEPGRNPTRLVPWVGEVTLKSTQVAFREPPESLVTIKDFMPCDQVSAQWGKREEDVVSALRAVAWPVTQDPVAPKPK
jgi:hypothetical protein